MADDREYVETTKMEAFGYVMPDGSDDYKKGFQDGVDFALDRFYGLPREDVTLVVHAHWQQGISGMYAGKCACSECTRTITGKLEDIEANCKFCPYCGAKMDEIQLAAKERKAGWNYGAEAPDVIEKE